MYIITADDSYTVINGTTVITQGAVIHYSGAFDKQYLALVAGLTLEMNKSGTLNLTLPPNNFALKNGYLRKLKTIIRIYRNSIALENLIWKGRILDSSRDFIGRVTFRCEGWMSVLCDSVVRPTKSGNSDDDTIVATPEVLFNALVEAHNAQVDPEKRLTPHVIGFGTGEGS